MYTFFQYNWQVRDEWFTWCEQLAKEELLKERIGGHHNILHTLLHIIDVEYSWVRAMQQKEDIPLDFSSYGEVHQVRELSHQCRDEIKGFLQSNEAISNERVTAPWMEGSFTRHEILHHIIAHEIHHIGQLSIWARELNLKPVSANVIFRGLF
ncbi:DinB family protein [Ornithinibacillus sp. BX22]|uniref:DinB family protein n=2 Tax=Ornithinibacillus TaxID=484508 RepID=A0A923RK24_9BACI|nr:MULTISPECIES: DinB family protein [Ornithinibacillus]MBC5638481.1 DinB family protein [Ornithinibacillus hominis]MBS3678719.1 DinB family protein [Ornithinibacillus massiliensis]